jgi:hypothetical protein
MRRTTATHLFHNIVVSDLFNIAVQYIALIQLKRDHVSASWSKFTLPNSGIFEDTKLRFSNLCYRFYHSEVSSNYG